MFKRIVVGCDGSPEGRDAVVLGAAIASATGAGLSLLGVFPNSVLPVKGMSDRRTLRSHTEKVLRAERSAWAPEAVTHAAGDFSVPRALRHYADRWNATLVVIGSSRDAADGRAVISRRGRQLIHDAPFAIAIAQHGLHERGFELASIGVGYDGGDEAAAALSLAAEIGAGADSRLDVLSVVADEVPIISAAEWISATEMPDPSKRRREAALADARSAAEGLDVAASVAAVVGDPGLRLRALSETVDLVVVGSRRWGAWSRLLAGSVGETLVHDAGCSVLIAPRPAQRSGHRAHRRGTPEAVA